MFLALRKPLKWFPTFQNTTLIRSIFIWKSLTWCIWKIAALCNSHKLMRITVFPSFTYSEHLKIQILYYGLEYQITGPGHSVLLWPPLTSSMPDTMAIFKTTSNTLLSLNRSSQSLISYYTQVINQLSPC